MSLVNQKIVLVLVQPSHATNTASVKLRGSDKILLQSININWMKMVAMIDFYVLLLARFCLVIILTTYMVVLLITVRGDSKSTSLAEGGWPKKVTKSDMGGGGGGKPKE